MGKERIDFIDRLQYLGLRLVTMGLHCFPVERNLRTAKLLGNFMYAVDRKHRERALANLRRSFPHMSEEERQDLARRSMQQLFMLFVEVLFTTRMVHIDTWAKYVELDAFREVLALLLKKKQGIILLTGHYGNWEILGYVMATLGFDSTAIARPLDNPHVNRWLLGVREKKGQRIIAKKGATGEVTEVLAQGGAVALIADQNAGSKGIFVDFFGRKASTYKSIALLAMEYDVPVVVGYARRIDNQFRFQCAVQDLIRPEDWKNQDDPLRYITQRYTRASEEIVREDPGQYLWVHRRWKTRPKGEEPEKYD
ncbi:MAG: lysophospholipid acyltransferase family protein [Phycisphaerales bacterium]|nr:lysophospholipid acyltransferase family protein [Phycisphaerales bacterium]